MSSKLKNILSLYLTIFSALVLFIVGGGLIVVPLLLGLMVSAYYYYLFIGSIILLPLVYIGLIKILSNSRFN